MKAVKITFGVLTGLWSLSLVIQLPGRITAASSQGAFGTSYILGVVVGIIVLGGVSFALFRSALRKQPPSPSEGSGGASVL